MKKLLLISLIMFGNIALAGENDMDDDDEPHVVMTTKQVLFNACTLGTFIEKGSNCKCIVNESIHQFGEADANEMVDYIAGTVKMDDEILGIVNMLVGRCK